MFYYFIDLFTYPSHIFYDNKLVHHQDNLLHVRTLFICLLGLQALASTCKHLYEQFNWELKYIFFGFVAKKVVWVIEFRAI